MREINENSHKDFKFFNSFKASPPPSKKSIFIKKMDFEINT